MAGRTDAGVHARGQVASFVTVSGAGSFRAIRDAINGRLAPEVVAIDVRRPLAISCPVPGERA